MSVLFLSQSMGLHLNDLVKLDELIEHAYFHSEEHGDNFFVFISKHYGELKAEHDKSHQEEQEDHEELPFQHQSQCSSNSIAVILLFNTEDLKSPKLVDHKDHNFFYQEPTSTLHSTGLIQPPRQV